MVGRYGVGGWSREALQAPGHLPVFGTIECSLLCGTLSRRGSRVRADVRSGCAPEGRREGRAEGGSGLVCLCHLRSFAQLYQLLQNTIILPCRGRLTVNVHPFPRLRPRHPGPGQSSWGYATRAGLPRSCHTRSPPSPCNVIDSAQTFSDLPLRPDRSREGHQHRGGVGLPAKVAFFKAGFDVAIELRSA